MRDYRILKLGEDWAWRELNAPPKSAGRSERCVADHFGDRHRDAARARRMHWIPVDCGVTQNLFWRVR